MPPSDDAVNQAGIFSLVAICTAIFGGAGEPATDVASSQVPPIDDAVNQAIIDAFLAMIKMGEPIQSDTKGGDHEQA